MDDLIDQARHYIVSLDSLIEKLSKSGERQQIAPSVLIAEGVKILGDIVIGENSSIWFNAVLRGDEGLITIGHDSNIQDCCVIHSDVGNEVYIGNWVTIGHGTVIRGATIGDSTTIGMNSTVMTGAVIPEYCFVGAHSFIPYGKTFNPRSLIYGVPAKVIRELNETEIQNATLAAQAYLKLSQYYEMARNLRKEQ